MATQNPQNQNAEAEAAAAAAQRETDAAAAAAAAKKPEEVAKAAPAGRVLEIGEVLRLSAVHGRIIHPFTLADFDTDRAVKVEVDAWIKVQFEAGKLKIED